MPFSKRDACVAKPLLHHPQAGEGADRAGSNGHCVQWKFWDSKVTKDESLTLGEQYWMNHCVHCEAKIGDHCSQQPGFAFSRPPKKR